MIASVEGLRGTDDHGLDQRVLRTDANEQEIGVVGIVRAQVDGVTGGF